MTEQLKPCPFCGGAAKINVATAFHRWYLHCSGCGIYSNMHNSEDEAVQAWNRRAPAGDALPQNWRDELYKRLVGRRNV